MRPDRRTRASGGIRVLRWQNERVTTIYIGGSWNPFRRMNVESPHSLIGIKLAKTNTALRRTLVLRHRRGSVVLTKEVQLLPQMTADLLARPVDAVDVQAQLFRDV